jgi:hypothetical protein
VPDSSQHLVVIYILLYANPHPMLVLNEPVHPNRSCTLPKPFCLLGCEAERLDSSTTALTFASQSSEKERKRET